MDNPTTAKDKLSFSWRFVAAPLAVFLFSIVITAIYFERLPAEVAYRFDLDGQPVSYIDSTTIVLMLLGAQLFSLLLATLAILGLLNYENFNKYRHALLVKPERLLTVMGNMPIVINIIFAFALLDIFTYNIDGTHLMSFWIFSIVVAVTGFIALGIFVVPIILRSIRGFKEYGSLQDKE